MHTADAQVILWEIGDVRCVLIRDVGEWALVGITIFQANHIVTNAVFLDDGAAADFAVGELYARVSRASEECVLKIPPPPIRKLPPPPHSSTRITTMPPRRPH